MLIGHFLLYAVGAQLADRAANVDACLVNGITKEITGIAADNEASLLCHEGTHVTDASGDDEVDAFHRYAAA